LLEQCTQETIVLQGSHVGIRKKSAGIFSDADAKGTAMAMRFVYQVPWIKHFCIQNEILGLHLMASSPASRIPQGKALPLWEPACRR